ncbi:MAG TPA: BTB/POZ domain-containing protein [Rhabdochlamydiaceae bacterium]|nr:BTB/POZ domain-containing protein [Rhabdochlamydiaceae bacterium]
MALASMSWSQNTLTDYDTYFRHFQRPTSVHLIDTYQRFCSFTISGRDLGKGVKLCQAFTDFVVEEVKRTRLNPEEQSCRISNIMITLTESFQLKTVALHLYRTFGIAIEKTDNPVSPRTIVVSWLRDHSAFYPVSPLVKINGSCTDTIIKHRETSYTIHRYIFSVRSSKFLELLQTAPFGQTVTFSHPDIETEVFEKFLEYFYKDRVDLRNLRAKQGRQVLDLANFFDLPYLRQQWHDELCDRVTIYNFSECLDFATNNKELNDVLFHEALQTLSEKKNLNPIADLLGLEKVVALANLDQRPVVERKCTEILKRAISNHHDQIFVFAEKFNFKELMNACKEHQEKN